MKLNKLFFAALSVAAIAFSACDPIPEDPDGPGQGGKDTTQVNPPAGSHTIEGLQKVTVAEALAICEALDTAKSTPVCYVCEAVVSVVNTNAADVPAKYDNVNFKIKDATGEISCQYTYYLDSVGFTSADQMPAVGDTVIVSGKLKKYLNKNNGACYNQFTNAYIYSISRKGNISDPEGLTGDGSQANPYTANDVITLANSKTGTYFVKGIIVGQVKGGATSANNNCEFAAPFTATEKGDNTNLLIAENAGVNDLANVVPVQLPSGFLRDALNLIAHPENLGKEVVLYGSLEKYFGQAGIKSITRAFIDGKEIVLESGEAPEATVATIAEFNAAAVNSTVPGVYYELTGTIGGNINTTYGNFDLTDATGTVYVYGLTANYLVLSSATKANNDKSYATLGLQAGDNITIRGVRADYNGKVEVLGAYFVKKN